MNKEYFESGIEWVGKIPVGWKVIPNKRMMFKVKNICNEYNGEDILSLSMNGVLKRDLDNPSGKMPESFDGYQRIKAGNLIMCLFDMDVTPRCIGLSNYDGLTSPAYTQFELFNKKYSKYYYYYYLYLDNTKELLHLSKNLRSSITDSQLGEMHIPVPCEEEAVKISDYLDLKCNKIDEIIDDNNKEIELLFEYKKSYIKEIFDKYLKKSNYINKKIGAISSLVTKQTGFDYSNTIKPSLKDDEEVDTIPYIQTRHFSSGIFDYNTEFHIPKEIAYKFPKILLNKKCLLFSIVGASIGTVVTFDNKKEAFLGGAICKVDLYDDDLYEYVENYMKSEYGQKQINDKINASAQPTITVQNVRDFVIPIFEKEDRDNLLNELTNVNTKIDKIINYRKKIIDKLEQYKKSLIYEVVTGKKEV